MKAGQPVDPIHGQRGKQRSVHNTYFTLPVLVAMLSQPLRLPVRRTHNWLVLVLVMLAGALIRHSFVARHKALVQGRRVPWELRDRRHRWCWSASRCGSRRRRRPAVAQAAAGRRFAAGAGGRRRSAA